MKSKVEKKLIVMFVTVLIFAGGTVFYQLSRHSEAGSQTVKYQCPMHPEYISNEKGSCPICGMDLVAIEPDRSLSASDGKKVGAESLCIKHDCPMLEEGKMCPMLLLSEKGERPECPVCKKHLGEGEFEEIGKPGDIAGYTAITLSPEKQQAIGIRTKEINRGRATKTIRTVGRIAYDPKLYQVEEEYLQAVDSWKSSLTGGNSGIAERAQRLVESARTKLELMGLSDELIEELKTAGKPDKSLLLSRKGEPVWMYAPIYEYDMGAVKAGQKVRVSADTVMPGKTYDGVVKATDPVLDPETRSVQARIRLENPDGILKPNVFVNGEIQVDLGEQTLIPETAVLDSGQRQVAFVERSPGIFEPRILKLGRKAGDFYVVISGVETGERVVDQATFFVDSESRLKAAIQVGGNAGAHQHE